MKTLIASLLVLASCSAMADVTIANDPLGSGVPGVDGRTTAIMMSTGMYFAPQYLPGYPTAAIIWPRYVEVNCDVNGSDRACDGYNWSPRMGRGEYLFFVPVNRAAPPAPVVVTNTVEKMMPCPIPVPVVKPEVNKKIGE